MLGIFIMILGGLKINFFFSRNLTMYTIRVSNGLDLDQAQPFVGLDLGTNCFQRLSVDDKVRR